MGVPVSGVQQARPGSVIVVSSGSDIVVHHNDVHRIDKGRCLVVTWCSDIDAGRYLVPLEETVSRVQLALRVADLDAAVEFYSRLFDTVPAKRRPGYANFAVTEPPLKLVLLEGDAGEPTRMDHLGVEVASTDEVTAATGRLADAGLATRVEDNTTCCYAVQDKVWVTGPGGEPWEVYTVTGDARPDLEGKTELELSAVAGDGTCCTPEGSDTDARLAASCC
jgi:catechol 2,3-dioxygenase-like lactoylglutathione lyase family enzyme